MAFAIADIALPNMSVNINILFQKHTQSLYD